MKKRKSINCPPFCKHKDCYETYEKRLLGGIPYMVWIIHCKALEKIHNKILGDEGQANILAMVGIVYLVLMGIVLLILF